MTETIMSLAASAKARLEADGLLQVVSGLNVPSDVDQERPLAQLYPDPGNAIRDRLAGGAQTVLWRMTAVLSGPTVEAVLWAAGHVRDLWADWRPDPDPASGPLNEQDIGARVIADTSEDIANPVYSISVQYRMHKARSTPA